MKVLQAQIKQMGLDGALFVTNESLNSNLFYLTGYIGAGILIIRHNDCPILHVPSRDLTQAKQVKGVEVTSGKKLIEMLAEKKIKVKRMGIDFANISVFDFNELKEKLNCEFIDLTETMNSYRAVKSNEEIKKILAACKITDKILGKFIKNFKKFKTEKDASAFLVYESNKLAEGVSFEPIVASGKNAAVPHHVPSGNMNKGFCVIDFGVKYKGYCSDVTRTIYFGKPDKSEEKTYYDLLENQEKAISLVKPGVSISDLCNHAEKNLKQKLIHSLGHGLGIEVHEMPYVSINSKDILKEGMVITIEPGEYVEGKYGIRIEDDVLVTANGQKVLSKFTKKLIIIK
ncbi:MAG: M24 family metallopeptidase [Candidatus Pacearchaeota archaeon]